MALDARVSKTVMPTVERGHPGQTAKNLGSWSDNLRATAVDFTPLIVGLAFLYDKTVIEGNPNRSWGFGDVVFVILLAWATKRMGVVRRWA